MFTATSGKKESKTKDFPRLKGRAGETRHLGGALRRVWAKYASPRTPGREGLLHTQIGACLRLSVEMEDLLDCHIDCFKLPQDAADDLENKCTDFLTFYSAIAREFINRRISLFNVTMKFHYLLHICMYSKGINPRKVWCFMGEDFMHRARTMAQSACRGTHGDLQGTKLMKKYIYAMDISMRGNGAFLFK